MIQSSEKAKGVKHSQHELTKGSSSLYKVSIYLCAAIRGMVVNPHWTENGYGF